MSIIIDDNCEENKIIEISPSGRFKRFNGILGEGSSKTVYKGIDLTNNTFIAWNIISLANLIQKNKEKICKEVEIFKSVNHKNILKMLNYWYHQYLPFIINIFYFYTLEDLKRWKNKIDFLFLSI